MACDRFSDALKQHAMGVALPAAAAAHLAICAGCQAALARERDLHGMILAVVDRVGRVEPAPDFRARLRESAIRRSHEHPRRRWPAAIAALGMAAGLSLAILLPGLTNRAAPKDQRPFDTADIALPRVMTASAESREVAELAEPAIRVLPSVPRRSSRRTRREQTTVVVPPGQIEALGRLSLRLRQQRSAIAQTGHDLHERMPPARTVAEQAAAMPDPAPLVFVDVVVPALVISDPFSGH